MSKINENKIKEKDNIKIINFIASWLNLFLKHKYIYKNYTIKKEDNCFMIYENERLIKRYIIDPFFVYIEDNLEKLKEETVFFVILLNTNENLKKMFLLWNVLKKIPNLNLIFVNPLSKYEKKWIINPNTHESISEGKIRSGIKAISDNVEFITLSHLKEIFDE